MKAITSTTELKHIQLEILSALDRFCRQNDIKYFLSDGTLLGAIRHKGYIPWDDDIDVSLNRDNYNRLVREFPKLFEGKYTLHSLETDEKWDRAYACISDERTIVEYSGNISCPTGVLIDIFPLDVVPDKQFPWYMLIVKMRVLSLLSAIKSMNHFHISKSFVKNLLAAILRIVLFPFSLRGMRKMMDLLARKYYHKEFKSCYQVAFGYYFHNRFKVSYFDELIEVDFENRKFFAPKEYDSVLTDAYGDYMKLPPEEERVTHHSLIAYWK